MRRELREEASIEVDRMVLRGTINWTSVFAALAASPADPHLVLELRNSDDIPDAMAYLERNGLAC